MLESILFSLQLAFNANDAAKEINLKRQSQNLCLVDGRCHALYDSQTESWIIRKKDHAFDNSRSKLRSEDFNYQNEKDGT